MLNKKIIIGLLSFAAILSSATPAFALTSDLNYNFTTENKDEFYNRGEMNLNFDGAIPDFLLDIYDFTPQPRYNSEFGSNIIVPTTPGPNQTTYAPSNAPSNGYVQSPAGLATGAVQGSYGAETPQYQAQSSAGTQSPIGTGQPSGSVLPGNANTASYPSYQDYTNSENPMYPITPIADVRNSDGSIGTLKISKIGLTITAYDGDTFAAMKRGIGHIASTSAWNSNIGLVGHNRGTSDYFGKLKNLKVGDEMTYTTKLGTRTYVVQSVTRIAETDWTLLQYTSDNRLTLLTCVEDVPSQRLAVSAVEKR